MMKETTAFAAETAELQETKRALTAQKEPVPETFTQEDVNRVVSDRLERERRNFKDYDQLRALLAGLRQKGVLASDSISGQIEELTALTEHGNGESCAHNSEIEPAAEFRPRVQPYEPKTEPPETKPVAANDSKAEPVMNTETATDADLAALVQNPMFPKFAKGKNSPFSELVEDFRDLLRMSGRSGSNAGVSAVTASDPAEQALRKLRSMPVCRTTGSAAEPPLSERQKEIARSGGMTYQEYYALIREIPDKKGRRTASEQQLP